MIITIGHIDITLVIKERIRKAPSRNGQNKDAKIQDGA